MKPRTDTQLIEGIERHWGLFAFIGEGEFSSLRGAIDDALDLAEAAERKANRAEAIGDRRRDEE